MANEIYNTSWWGTALDTARTAGTNPDFFGSQFKLLTSEQDNLVTNGDFATDSDWYFVGEAELTEQGARIYSSSGGQSYITQNILTITKNYKITYDIVYNTQGSLKLINVNGISDYPIPSTIGSHTAYFTANSTTLFIYRNSGATDVTITNISVKEARADEVEAKKCLADWIHRTALQDLNN